MRDLAKPNLLVQDGPKPRFFCAGCEGLFASWERQVAEHVFRPLHEGTATSFWYGSWLLSFAVSVSFRVLALHGDELVELKDGPRVSSAERAAVNELGSANGAWAQFLRGDREVLGPYEHYCIALPTPPDLSQTNSRISSYFEGEINFRPPVQAPDGGIYVVTKMCRLCLVGTAVRGRRSDWVNTRISAGRGVIASPYAIPRWLVNYFVSVMRVSEASILSMSPRQSARLVEKGNALGWTDPESMN